MTYSELKKTVKNAHENGLRKIPKMGVWERKFSFPFGMRAVFRLTNSDLLYSRIPLNERIHKEYERYKHQAIQKARLMGRG